MNIKRIIFDLDNTLIIWNNSYYDTLDKTLNYYKINYDQNLKNKLIKAVNDYESIYDHYEMKLMKSLMEKYIGQILPENFVYKWTVYLEDCYPREVDKDLLEILDYLKQKYELCVLTNWFEEEQKNRLKNMGILSYFKFVLGTEKILNKPNKQAFIEASKPYKLEECLVIGDSVKNDIEPSLSLKMNAILYDYKNECNISIKKIKNWNELKNIL